MEDKVNSKYAKFMLEWFDENKRDMPWRRTSDPYSIWVSEVMLQQTQVDTVIPYYIKFMERFPTIHDLAVASLEEVHHYWQGLGYYRRAENLQKGAKMIDEKWNGVFPNDPKLVKDIPSIGPYTLGAVCSIAFHIPLPAVDGNVMRILARQFRISDDIGVAKNRKIFEEKVMELMPDDPNRFNQSLMELGALVCTPKNPKCDICPVRTICEAHRYGEEEKYPIKEKKIKAAKEQYQVVLLKKGQRYGLEKRPVEGLLANLWGTPMIDHKVWKDCELNTYEQRELTEVIHIFTHKKWQMTPVVINWSQRAESLLKENKTNGEPLQYYTLEEMEDIPVATAFKKILQKL